MAQVARQASKRVIACQHSHCQNLPCETWAGIMVDGNDGAISKFGGVMRRKCQPPSTRSTQQDKWMCAWAPNKAWWITSGPSLVAQNQTVASKTVIEGECRHGARTQVHGNERILWSSEFKVYNYWGYWSQTPCFNRLLYQTSTPLSKELWNLLHYPEGVRNQITSRITF